MNAVNEYQLLRLQERIEDEVHSGASVATAVDLVLRSSVVRPTIRRPGILCRAAAAPELKPRSKKGNPVMSFADYHVNAEIERGCGRRQDGALYACSGTSSYGRPVEDFIVDPPLPWTLGPFRGVRPWSKINASGQEVHDMMLWVGAENYPFVPDFVEEGRMHGFCKRIPTGRLDGEGGAVGGPAQYGKVRPSESRMVLIHPKAIAESSYLVHYESGLSIGRDVGCSACGSGANTMRTHLTEHVSGSPSCTFATWDLSALADDTPKHGVDLSDVAWAAIKTPSVLYRVRRHEESDVPPTYAPGIFLALPVTHFEYVRQDGEKSVPESVASLLGDNIRNLAVCEQ